MSMDEIYGSSRPYESHEHEIQEHGCNSHEHTRSAASNCSVSSFGSDFSRQEPVLDQGYYNHEDNRPCIIRWKSGKRVDPRLLTLLESFREVYVKRKEFFKRIFPGLYNEFVDVFQKFGAMLLKNNEMKSRSLERSLSFGSFHALGHTEEGSELMLEAFKVKPPKVIVAGSGSQTDKS